MHRRRKILKVGGAEYPIAREARAKILRPRPLHVKPRPFLHDRGCYHEFLGEKINCKSSRIDLVAIEAYLLIIRPGKCLKIFIVTILGWRTMGALPPFLNYWGGYSPLSPPRFLRLCYAGTTEEKEKANVSSHNNHYLFLRTLFSIMLI